MKKVERQYRQGDVLVSRIEVIPASAKPIACKHRVVLAEGEATGHSHSIEYQAKQMRVFTDGPQLYLRVSRSVVLRHQEHAPATIEPGDYIVIRQVEVWLDEVRQVMD